MILTISSVEELWEEFDPLYNSGQPEKSERAICLLNDALASVVPNEFILSHVDGEPSAQRATQLLFFMACLTYSEAGASQEAIDLFFQLLDCNRLPATFDYCATILTVRRMILTFFDGESNLGSRPFSVRSRRQIVKRFGPVAYRLNSMLH